MTKQLSRAVSYAGYSLVEQKLELPVELILQKFSELK